MLIVLTSERSSHAQTPKTPETQSVSTAITISDKLIVPPITRAFRNDAALNRIFFINESTGWAVGDRGVIWHTTDAGATWREQSSPVTCTLNDIFFISPRRGWAVGGQSQPYSSATGGVLLRTDDGGTTWNQIPQPLLPKLVGIKFFDGNQGIAVGQSASYYPSGVFATRDGGNSWQPLPSDESGSWLAGDFVAPDAGAVAGPAGHIATLVRHKVVASPLAAASLRSVRAMQLIAPTGGWAVGDGGLILTTSDLGQSWQTPEASPRVTESPQRAGESFTNQFDFQAVATQADQVWIAGSPGTCIFHSPDAGKTWQSAATGQTAPLRSIQFIDNKNGWAAGDFGNILVTHDGGQIWQTQRSGAKRAALLAIFANPTDVPLEVLADCGAADGYITAVNILCTPFDSLGEPASAGGDRSKEALLQSGAATSTTAWQFPLPPADLALSPEDLLAALNRENDGRALQQLESYLVRQLRTYRPDVVITHDSTGATRTAATAQSQLAVIVSELVRKSVAAAADPTEHPELTADAGLAPWQVKKLYGLTPPGIHGTEAVDTEKFSPWLGATFADFASPARSLLFNDRAPAPDRYEFQLLLSRLEDRGNARGLFSGISLPYGSEARRPQPELPVHDIDALRRLALRRRTLEQLLQRSEGNAAWVAQVTQMTEGLSDDDAGKLLAQLAEGYRNAGRLDLAADTYFLLARRAPDHPLADAALTWLLHFYASSEIAHRVSPHTAFNIRPAPISEHDGAVASATVKSSADTSNNVAQTSANTLLPTNEQPTLSHDDRLHRAVQLADYLKTAKPALYAEPATRFAEIVAQRELGYANPAKRLFIALKQLPESDPWRECAATEEWLEKPADLPPPKKLAACRRTFEPPRLDGHLDEPFWQTADRMTLSGSNAALNERAGEGLAEARIAYDDQFIYIAVHCLKVANLKYETDDRPRTHDADLVQHDRVSFAFDVDRDYSTAFEFTVDDRGWTHDACWGDATWNPTWYVASAADDNSWTIEAAIPTSELIDRAPAIRDIWAVSIRRTIPRTGYQSWAAPTSSSSAARDATTSAASPTQFGLVIFEPAAAPPTSTPVPPQPAGSTPPLAK